MCITNHIIKIEMMTKKKGNGRNYFIKRNGILLVILLIKSNDNYSKN